ncbi:hypothetical protein FOYG_15009 [Fusarium oxysporum NRRL 32931]|uniref:Uncharacterized protein n=1 Tax=Fusarium oxysporum NRRL 32931 TaxID=660029 RepID=W9HKZ5_FUSOX|nr:hypothetical protein FOYG_15009 [Fusarium oxysporum NRRL 32931]
MYSLTKLFVAVVALSTFASTNPIADKGDTQNLEARGGCLGYANYNACLAGRHRACPIGAGQATCFATASKVCQQNC